MKKTYLLVGREPSFEDICVKTNFTVYYQVLIVALSS